MNVLLDTHTLLWALADSPQLNVRARDVINDPAIQLHLSIASLWEIAIKLSLGKLTLDGGFAGVIEAELTHTSLTIIPIRLAHLALLVTLPFHHRDPFDRLIGAQALVEGYPILSRDLALDAYAVDRWW